MSGASLDLLGAQPTSVAARQQRRRNSSGSNGYDRRSPKAAVAAAGVHGGYIGSVSAGIYKSFRERFMNGAVSAGSGSSSSDVDYRVLRQRDAEAGKLSSSGSSSDEEQEEDDDQEEEGLSSSSVEDLFASEAERRKWRRKAQPERRSTAKGKRSRRRKVSAARSGPGSGAGVRAWLSISHATYLAMPCGGFDCYRYVRDMSELVCHSELYTLYLIAASILVRLWQCSQYPLHDLLSFASSDNCINIYPLFLLDNCRTICHSF